MTSPTPLPTPATHDASKVEPRAADAVTGQRPVPTLQNADPRALKLNPQVRSAIDATSITELAQSLRSVGLLQPIVTYRDPADGALIVLDGARRTLAAIEAGLDQVSVLIDRPPESAADRSLKQLIANIQRLDLSPLDQADAIAGLMADRQWTAAQAASHIGKSPATVSKLLSLRTLPAAIRKDVAAGAIGLKAGHRIARVADPAKQQALADQLKAAGASENIVNTAANGDGTKAAVDPASATASGGQTRLTAVVDKTCSVVLIGVEPTFDAVGKTLKSFLTGCRIAEKQGVSLTTYLRMLRDQARA